MGGDGDGDGSDTSILHEIKVWYDTWTSSGECISSSFMTWVLRVVGEWVAFVIANGVPDESTSNLMVLFACVMIVMVISLCS